MGGEGGGNIYLGKFRVIFCFILIMVFVCTPLNPLDEAILIRPHIIPSCNQKISLLCHLTRRYDYLIGLNYPSRTYFHGSKGV